MGGFWGDVPHSMETISVWISPSQSGLHGYWTCSHAARNDNFEDHWSPFLCLCGKGNEPPFPYRYGRPFNILIYASFLIVCHCNHLRNVDKPPNVYAKGDFGKSLSLLRLEEWPESVFHNFLSPSMGGGEGYTLLPYNLFCVHWWC